MLAGGLQKDLHSWKPPHHSQEFDKSDFVVPIASVGCRQWLGFSWLLPLSWFGSLTGRYIFRASSKDHAVALSFTGFNICDTHGTFASEKYSNE